MRYTITHSLSLLLHLFVLCLSPASCPSILYVSHVHTTVYIHTTEIFCTTYTGPVSLKWTQWEHAGHIMYSGISYTMENTDTMGNRLHVEMTVHFSYSPACWMLYMYKKDIPRCYLSYSGSILCLQVRNYPGSLTVWIQHISCSGPPISFSPPPCIISMDVLWSDYPMEQAYNSLPLALSHACRLLILCCSYRPSE